MKDHTICGACRVVWLGNNTSVHKGSVAKKERCCRCGYMTLFGVKVKRAHSQFYCQKNNIHEEDKDLAQS